MSALLIRTKSDREAQAGTHKHTHTQTHTQTHTVNTHQHTRTTNSETLNVYPYPNSYTPKYARTPAQDRGDGRSGTVLCARGLPQSRARAAGNPRCVFYSQAISPPPPPPPPPLSPSLPLPPSLLHPSSLPLPSLSPSRPSPPPLLSLPALRSRSNDKLPCLCFLAGLWGAEVGPCARQEHKVERELIAECEEKTHLHRRGCAGEFKERNKFLLQPK